MVDGEEWTMKNNFTNSKKLISGASKRKLFIFKST
jgi:hypothetical protein